MAKIGRNQTCPCGSGKKYKHCCLPLKQSGEQQSQTPMARMKISLMAEIEKIQQAASEKREQLYELGVFIFFSMNNGDAWVLEVSESDAVKVAQGGEAMEPPVDENPETIEINWSHTYELRDRQLFLTSYEDKSEALLDRAPTQQINAAVRRVIKRYSPDVLSQIHVRNDSSDEAVG